MKAQKQIKTEITINVPKEKVWKVLTDMSNYQNWNPFIIKSEGEVVLGNRLINTMKNGEKEMTFKPKVTAVVINQYFEWIGHLFIPGLFDGRHYFKLEELENGKTRLIQGEYFKGILSGLVLKSIKENTTKGFVEMNEALKTEVEKS